MCRSAAFLSLLAFVAAARNYTLLGGDSQYSYLDGSHSLQRPSNDVELVAKLLSSHRFKFPAKNITSLAGWPSKGKLRPTRKNILGACDSITRKMKEGDQVFILMTGHGSQQLASEDPNDRETDGFDEIFLPADAKSWQGDGDTAIVKNAIVDDEVRSILSKLQEKGAFVWIIFDSCHSGTMMRGAPENVERERRIDPAALIGQEAVAKARSAAPKTRSTSIAKEEAQELASAGSGVVAMYASQPSEPTYERPLPGGADKMHSLFTFTLAQVIYQSRSSLTYRELAERVLEDYRVNSRFQPTPLIEGTRLDQAVLGNEQWPDRPSLLVKGMMSQTGIVVLSAGHLHGIRERTILAVYRPAGAENADEIVGHVVVSKAMALTTTARPVDFEGMAAPEKINRGSRCRIIMVDYGHLRLNLAIQSAKGDKITTHAVTEGPPELAQALGSIVLGTHGAVKWVGDDKEVDWYLRLTGKQVTLVPASGWPQRFTKGNAAAAESAQPQFDLGVIDDELPARLFESVGQVAKARHLLGMAQVTSSQGRGRSTSVDVNLEMIKYKDEGDADGVVLPHGDAGRELRSGDLISFRINNPTKHTVDVTLLFIDSGYGITALFPEPGTIDDNRLGPGESFTLPRVEVTADTIGAEQVVAIAVKSGKDRQDFSMLEQPTMEQVRAVGGNMQSPLAQLLSGMMYGANKTRGLRKSEVDTYSVRMLPWVTHPLE